jgi:hypothetical protein
LLVALDSRAVDSRAAREADLLVGPWERSASDNRMMFPLGEFARALDAVA